MATPPRVIIVSLQIKFSLRSPSLKNKQAPRKKNPQPPDGERGNLSLTPVFPYETSFWTHKIEELYPRCAEGAPQKTTKSKK